jgi:hypothetical protein
MLSRPLSRVETDALSALDDLTSRGNAGQKILFSDSDPELFPKAL